MYKGYVDGKNLKVGFGVLIDAYKIQWEGTWENDSIIGVCKVRYPSGDSYQGEVKNRAPHGMGKMWFISSGDIYQG